jgi:hypothetical protein
LFAERRNDENCAGILWFPFGRAFSLSVIFLET